MYKTITQCRACGGTNLEEVFSFNKPMPLANDFSLPGGERQGFVPLRVMFCVDCTLGQLGEVVNPDVLYRNYLYVTSSSETMRRHFDRLLKDLASENHFGSIMEAGSNDGLFLNYARTHGFEKQTLVGIDPAENLAGSDTHIRVTGMFSATTSPVAQLKPDFIVARHCFCHLEWQDFMLGCEVVAKENTIVAIEVPYCPDLLAKTEFDTIYSEHTSFLTIKSVVALLKNFPFHLHAVLRYGVHGGCVLLMLRHNDSKEQPHLSADEFVSEENVTMEEWLKFSIRAHDKINRLAGVVNKLAEDGQIVSGFGASAKCSTLISACEFTDKQVKFVTDNSPLKPGRLVPGTQIPVIPEEQMLSEHPDYAIMGAWNYEKEICAKMSKWRERGGKFIVPDNEIRVI